MRKVDPEKDSSASSGRRRDLRKELGDQTALIGFAGAPYTLASYASRGEGLQDLRAREDDGIPGAQRFQALLDKLTDAVIDYLVMQVRAGCDAVQLFDSWGGNLTPEAFERYALPCARRIFDVVPARRRALDPLRAGERRDAGERGCGRSRRDRDRLAHVVARAIRRLGSGSIVQGNLDPLALFAPPPRIEEMCRSLVADGRSARGHIFNVGHGLIPSTPIAGVEALVRGVREAPRS